MKYCAQCGASMEDTAKFCQTCGTPCRNVEAANAVSEETTVLNANNMSAQNNIRPQPYIPKPPEKKKLSNGAIVAIVVAAVVLLISLGIVASVLVNDSSNPSDSVDLPEVPTFDVDTENLFTLDKDTFGNAENGKYTNSFAGLEFYAPSDEWVFMSKDEIYTHFTDSSGDVFFDEETKETYYSSYDGKVYYDMLLYNTVTNESVQVMVTSSTAMTLDDYLSSLEDEMNNTYENVTVKDAGTITLGNNSYSIKQADVVYSGMNVRQCYAGTRIGNRFVTICVTCDNSTDDSFTSIINSITQVGE